MIRLVETEMSLGCMLPYSYRRVKRMGLGLRYQALIIRRHVDRKQGLTEQRPLSLTWCHVRASYLHRCRVTFNEDVLNDSMLQDRGCVKD